MLKNLLTPKLYQFLYVLFLLICFSSVKAYAQFGTFKYSYTTGGKTYETNCWGPRNIGTASEDTKIAECIEEGASCKILYASDVANQMIEFVLLNGDPHCYKGDFKDKDGTNKVFYTSFGNNKYPVSGGFRVYRNKPLSESFNILATTLAECQNNVSKKRIQNTVLNKFYTDVASCWAEEYSSSDKIEDLSTVSNCYYMRTGYAYNAGRLSPKREASCSCYYGGYFFRNQNPSTWNSGWDVFANSWNAIKGEFTNISIHHGVSTWFGSSGIQHFKSGATIEENIAACETSNPNKYYNKLSGQCYPTAVKCNEINDSYCDENKENRFFIKQPGGSWIETTLKNISDLTTTCNSSSAIPGAPRNPSCANLSTASRCSCSTEFNPLYNVTYCTLNPSDSAVCSKKCKYVKVDLKVIEPISIQSPLALINVIANFLFWAAVAIFIFNILSAAFSYIRNADQPDKLKEASDHITGTIFGFIFLLVAAGVINYIIRTLTTFGL